MMAQKKPTGQDIKQELKDTAISGAKDHKKYGEMQINPLDAWDLTEQQPSNKPYTTLKKSKMRRKTNLTSVQTYLDKEHLEKFRWLMERSQMHTMTDFLRYLIRSKYSEEQRKISEDLGL